MKTLVLGIGNVLWGDEGFGPKVVERLKQRHAVAAGVELVDGGTQGLYLLPLIQDTDRLIVFDAVDFGKKPGAIVVLRNEEIPAYFGQRPLSLHQTAFTDVLAAASLTGALPESITLIGVQFENIDAWGGDLSPAVSAAIDQAIAIGLSELESWEEATYA
ncbi:MAG: HyaD/HybD family hydrogenase maturation endopeptidase [Sterolibacterium sp.]